MPQVPATYKLSAIEGLRGYLALAVMFTHIIVYGALIKNPAEFFHFNYHGVTDFLLLGNLPVNCFMIISGFVIFMAIDRKQERYGVYLLRRAMRIYPLYLICLAASLPCLYLWGLAVDFYGPFMDPAGMESIRQEYASDWANIGLHLPLHLLLMHGMVPDAWLAHSSTAFLGPAWSLSLEWQFYLIAPLWYASFLAQSWRKACMFGLCLLCVFTVHSFFTIGAGAMLPAQITYFLAGILSYLIYKPLRNFPFRADLVLPLIVIFELGLYRLTNRPPAMVPLLGWSLVLGLLFEPEKSVSSRLVAPIFTNPVILWLGKISYSLYLAHGCVLGVAQYLTLRWDPAISQAHLLMVLIIAVPTCTVAISSLLYIIVEQPCIDLGKRWAGEPLKVSVGLKDSSKEVAPAKST